MTGPGLLRAALRRLQGATTVNWDGFAATSDGGLLLDPPPGYDWPGLPDSWPEDEDWRWR